MNPFTLNELASQGGGYAEMIASDADLGPATERIAEELNNQYMIGYTPTTRADGKYHGRFGSKSRARSTESDPAWSHQIVQIVRRFKS